MITRDTLGRSHAIRKARPQGLAGGNWFWVGIAIVSLLLVGIWAAIPWQWSPVDDPGQHMVMRELMSNKGYPRSFAMRVAQLADGDFSGGVFRPMAWVYPPLLYWMPTGAAHIARLIMILVILIGPITYFRRSGASGLKLTFIAVLLTTSAGALYQGLLLLSIQEIGGMALVSLGLLIMNLRLRLAAWILAALFKAPFSWILLGYSVYLWRKGDRRLSILSGVAGLLVLGINFWWSRSGTYTSRYRLDPFDPELWNSASRILEPINGAILLTFLWWLVVTRSRAKFHDDSVIFAIAFGGYFIQMTPWGFTAYYMGPISFFLGLMLASLLPEPHVRSGFWRIFIALSLPALISIWVVRANVGWVFQSNEVIRLSSECLARHPGSIVEVSGNWLYITTSEEGPIRLGQNTSLMDPTWVGSIYLKGARPPQGPELEPTHELVFGPRASDELAQGSSMCDSEFVRFRKST